MNREDRKALEAYLQAVLSERERFLYQSALNKVRVITRSMKPAEKEEYASPAAAPGPDLPGSAARRTGTARCPG